MRDKNLTLIMLFCLVSPVLTKALHQHQLTMRHEIRQNVGIFAYVLSHFCGNWWAIICVAYAAFSDRVRRDTGGTWHCPYFPTVSAYFVVGQWIWTIITSAWKLRFWKVKSSARMISLFRRTRRSNENNVANPNDGIRSSNKQELAINGSSLVDVQ